MWMQLEFCDVKQCKWAINCFHMLKLSQVNVSTNYSIHVDGISKLQNIPLLLAKIIEWSIDGRFLIFYHQRSSEYFCCSVVNCGFPHVVTLSR